MPKNPSSNGAMDVTSPKRARTQGGASAKGKKVLISDPIEQAPHRRRRHRAREWSTPR